MRWKYPYPASPSEAVERRKTLRAIDAWWKAFAENADAIDAYYAKSRDFDIVAFTREHLGRLPGDLSWEYGPARGHDGHRLVITPEGKRAFRPLVDDVVARAPVLPRWEFYGYRLAEPLDMAMRTAGAISRHAPAREMPLVAVRRGRHNRVDLTYQIPRPEHEADRPLASYLFRAIEQLVGEAVLDKWIGYVGPAEPDEPIATRPGGAVVPFARLQGTVDAVIAATREQLPPRARHEVSAEERAAREGVLYELKRPSDLPNDDAARSLDQYLGTTDDPDLIFATRVGDGFCSERFSSAGETFCYLKIDAAAVPDGDRVEHRSNIEEAIDAALNGKKLGCVVGGGTGTMYSYIDLALTDVSSAISQLRTTLRRDDVDRRTWLLFHDADLIDEWVGVYDNTPSPPADPPED